MRRLTAVPGAVPGRGYVRRRTTLHRRSSPLSRHPQSPQSRALLRYAAGWLIAGLAVVGVAFGLVRLGEEEVSLPPVRQTELTEAAVAAGCELRGDVTADVRGPRVDGPRSVPAAPGVYSRPVSSRALIGALRRGTIVIHYHASLASDRVEQLEELQEAVPVGTIVTPSQDMRYTVAVTAWRQLLGCRQFNRNTIDAIRLFRGRFIGTGPDG